jgi:hypothetical protein
VSPNEIKTKEERGACNRKREREEINEKRERERKKGRNKE